MMRKLIVLTIVITLGGCVTVDPTKRKKWSQDDRATLHTQMGVNYFRQGQITVAREELELALRIDPYHSAANHAMAVLERQYGQVDRAGYFYNRAVRGDKNNLSARNDYGYYLCNQGDTDGGKKQFEIALQNPLNTARHVSMFGAGECERLAGDLESAANLYRQTLAIQPDTKPALLQLARIHFDQQQYFQTRGFLERYFENRFYTDASLYLAVLNELELGNRDLAGEYAKRLRTRFPKSALIANLGDLFRGGT